MFTMKGKPFSLALTLLLAILFISGCVGARMGVSWPAVGLITINGEENIALAYNNDVAILSPANGAPPALNQPHKRRNHA